MSQFNEIKRDAQMLGEILGDSEKAAVNKHIGGIIREIAMEKGIKLKVKRSLLQKLSDIAHSMGYKKKERDMVKKMMGLSTAKTIGALPSAAPAKGSVISK